MCDGCDGGSLFLSARRDEKNRSSPIVQKVTIMKRSLNFCGQYLINSNRLHHVVNRSQNTNVQHALRNRSNNLYPFVPCLMMLSSTAGGGTREATYYHHPITTHRCLFSNVKKNKLDLPPGPANRGRRVWKAHQQQTKSYDVCDDAGVDHVSVSNDFWCTAVDEAHDCQESLSRICEQVSEVSLLQICYNRLFLSPFLMHRNVKGGG